MMYQYGHESAESTLEPAEIVKRVQVGDTSAESEFVKRYSRSLLLMLKKRTNGDESVAEECTQEALLITLAKMRAGEIRKPEHISAFLRQTGIYVTVNYYRKQNRFVEFNHDNVIYLGAQSNMAEVEINSEQIRLILNEVLSKLPVDRDREILHRFFLLEYSKEKVCEDLDLSPGQFNRVLFRARKRIRKIINKNKPLEALLLSEVLDTIKCHE